MNPNSNNNNKNKMIKCQIKYRKNNRYIHK